MSEPQARMSLGEVILAIECIRDDIPTGYCSRGDIWNGLNDLLPKLRAAIGHEWPDKGAGTRTPAPIRDVSENCDICGHGDEVDPRAVVSFGPSHLVAHPQCLFDAADSIYRTELGCSPTDKGAPRFTPEEREALRGVLELAERGKTCCHGWGDPRCCTCAVRALLQEGTGG